MLWIKNRQREKSRQLSLIEFRPLKYSSMLIFDKFRIRGLIPRAHMWAYQLLRLKSSWRWGNCVVLPPPRVDNCSLKNALIYLKIRFETNIVRIDQALIKQKIICPAHWGRTKAPEYISLWTRGKDLATKVDKDKHHERLCPGSNPFGNHQAVYWQSPMFNISNILGAWPDFLRSGLWSVQTTMVI